MMRKKNAEKASLFLGKIIHSYKVYPDLYLKPSPESTYKHCRKWTGKIIDLVEIIYAIDTKKCVDNGNISIIELSDHIGQCFGVCFKDCYSSYIDIRRRKNNSRTYFLDDLSKSLNDRMDNEDEK